MYDCLQKHNIQLASNQVEFSLLRRTPETSGLIAECHKRGIAVLGYSPLVSYCCFLKIVYSCIAMMIFLFFND
jgi:diketogulonate reductase-like aldo/keto reductase